MIGILGTVANLDKYNVKDNIISDNLRSLVLIVQFKKHKKHPWWSDTFGKVAGFKFPKWYK